MLYKLKLDDILKIKEIISCWTTFMLVTQPQRKLIRTDAVTTDIKTLN